MVSTTTHIWGIALPSLRCPASGLSMPAGVTLPPTGFAAESARTTARNTDVKGFPPRGPAPA